MGKMSFFFYWQKVGGEDLWQLALADSRSEVVAKENPRFVTVLDVSMPVEDTFTREQFAALKYRGPLYFDLDGEDIELVLEKTRFLFGKLVEHDVDPRAVRLFATGGRGFHLEVPWEIFIPKVSKAGVGLLPAIYKEMAYGLYVDTLDLRVYSGRKGRMWRTPNVRRENGRYKVPVSPEELMEMRAQDYQGLCSAPREAPSYAPPALSQKLAVLYAKAAAKIEAAAKKRKDAKKDFELLARFKGDYPPSLAKVMSGEIVNDTQGFHMIALQVAITSNALGKSEEQMLAACAGVIEKHQSDGSRYNTPAKRKAELSRLYDYTADNPCYEYSRDAVRKLLPVGTPSSDLDGLTEQATGSVTAEGDDGNDEGLLGGVFVTEKGVFVKGEDGARKISAISYRDVHMLCSAETGEPFGYETEILLKGISRGRRLVDTSVFVSKQKFNVFCLQAGGAFTGNDNHVGAVHEILRDTAMKNNKVVYIVHREGLDLLQRPDTDKDIVDFAWVTPSKITTNSDLEYKHRGSPNPDGYFKSDLMEAPEFKASDDSAAVVEALLNFNDPYVVGNMLGWFTSAFHRQVYHRLPDSKFPIMQVFGQAGSGKTSTVLSLLRLFYHLSPPIMLPADASTLHGIRSAIQSSASIPVALDEFKPRQFGPGKYTGLLQIMRSAYNAQTLAKGGMADGIGSSWRDVRLFAFSAPVLFIGEALESESAMLERTISVPLAKGSLTGREAHHRLLTDKRSIVSALGKQIVRATFELDIDQFKSIVLENEAKVGKVAFKRNNHRVVFNLAVLITGLDFLQQIITHHFGSTFDEQFDNLRLHVLDVSKHVAVSVMPEAAKVLNIISFMSRTEDPLSEFGLREGVDYAYQGEFAIDLQMRNCYYKYVGWARRKGQVPLYDSEEAFLHGLGNYAPCENRACANSSLKVTGMEKLFRFNLARLAEEGVEPFRPAA